MIMITSVYSLEEDGKVINRKLGHTNSIISFSPTYRRKPMQEGGHIHYLLLLSIH